MCIFTIALKSDYVLHMRMFARTVTSYILQVIVINIVMILRVLVIITALLNAVFKM